MQQSEPHVDIHCLFQYYNHLYFDSQLGACSVEWSSKRMTMCGGTCEYRGGGCRIKLSEPLLKFRPAKDVKDVLLHEMIHAYLFLKHIKEGDHGPHFRKMMTDINKATNFDDQRPPEGYNIDVYHTMHAEVNHYRVHHWQCERCGKMVKRATNRCPQNGDCRGLRGRGANCDDPHCSFHMHVKHCGGQFVKIAEPAEYTNKTSTNMRQDSSTAKFANGKDLPAKRPSGQRNGTDGDILELFKRHKPPDTTLDSKQEVDSSKLVPGVDSGAAASTSAALKQHAMPASQMRSVLAAAAMRRIQSQGRGQTKPTAAASEVQVVEAGPQALSLSRRHSVEVIDLIDSQS